MKLNLTCKYDLNPPRRTCNTSYVQTIFGIEFDSGENIIAEKVEIDYRPGQVVLFTGASGSGKSSLLRLAAELVGDCAVLAEYDDAGDAIIDLLDLGPEKSLSLLGACGLSEAMLMLRSPSQLSDGQRYRFALAKCLAGLAKTIVADEWCAKLDRTTARVISNNVRKLSDARGVGFLLATTHEDMIEDLAPDVLVRCHGGGEVAVEYRRGFRSKPDRRAISFIDQFEIVEGSLPDWAHFARWHYRGHTLGPVKKVYLLLRGNEPVAIAVLGPGPLSSSARNRCFGLAGFCKTIQAKIVNTHFISVMRLVIDPRYRGAGIAWRFLASVCKLRDEPWIELVSELAPTSRFCEAAGFVKVGQGADKIKAFAKRKHRTAGGFYSAANCTPAAIESYRRRSRYAMPTYYLFDNRKNGSGRTE